jgi:hypothetical protein
VDHAKWTCPCPACRDYRQRKRRQQPSVHFHSFGRTLRRSIAFGRTHVIRRLFLRPNPVLHIANAFTRGRRSLASVRLGSAFAHRL